MILRTKVHTAGWHRLRPDPAMEILCSIVFLLSSVATTFGQESPPAESENPETTDVVPAPEEPPTLDDLLGLDEEEEEDEAAAATAEEQNREKLDDLLTETEVADAFESAVAKMSLSADLLDTDFDPGLGTQRVQEDIIARLDALIADAAKKGQSSSSSSSSSSKQSAQPKQKPPSQSQSKSQSQAQKQGKKPGEPGENMPPALKEGELNSIIDESRIEWGSLPQRVRDEIQQGMRDRASSLYRQLTEEYYRRIADEVSR